jgi:phospholipid-binding lipoprotein MlaA
MLAFKRILNLCLVGFACSFAMAEEDYLTLDDLYDEELEFAEPQIRDPFEPVNRVLFKFNDFVYIQIFDPVTTAYTWVLPDAAQSRLTNFFDNLKTPVRLAGNLLQGKMHAACVESGRFVVNTTIGLAGFNRAADKFAVLEAPSKEDAGQALGAWGIASGPYLVLPIFGPSSPRDLVGRVIDRAVDPLKFPLAQVDEWEYTAAYSVGGILVSSPQLLSRYYNLKETTLDPYVAMRNGYFQYREAAVQE